ncbi:MAG: hypothetical protein ABIG60_00370 [Patescibacteria group bacterium]|nr:hypothetical protein [Patescibacteria group bacterium]
MSLLREAAVEVDKAAERQRAVDSAVGVCQNLRSKCVDLLIDNGARERTWLRLAVLPYFMIAYRSSPGEALDRVRLDGSVTKTVREREVQVGVSIYSTVADPKKGTITVEAERSRTRLRLRQDSQDAAVECRYSSLMQPDYWFPLNCNQETDKFCAAVDDCKTVIDLFRK